MKSVIFNRNIQYHMQMYFEYHIFSQILRFIISNINFFVQMRSYDSQT